MKNVQKFQLPQGLQAAGTEHEGLRRNVDFYWDNWQSAFFHGGLPLFRLFDPVLTCPAEFRANIACIADLVEVVGVYAQSHEGRQVCEAVNLALNLAWVTVEFCRQEPGWAEVADDLAFRAARMIERHDKCCRHKDEPDHLLDDLTNHDYEGPVFRCNIDECRAEIQRLKTAAEDRRKPTRRAREIAWSALQHAWDELRDFQREFEYVLADELVVRKEMPAAIRYLSNIGLAVCIFVRTMTGRAGIEPLAADLLIDEDGDLERLIFGDEDEPSAFERAERAECLARVFEALVQAKIAGVKTSNWKDLKAAKNWGVLGHQAIAYAQWAESHWGWLVPLICHRPERPLDESTINDVWHVKRIGDAAETYTRCFEAQMLLCPRSQLNLPEPQPSKRRPRPESCQLEPAGLPELTDGRDISPAEIRRDFLAEWGANAPEDNWLKERGVLPYLSWEKDRLSPMKRLIGFDTTRSGRGHRNRQRTKRKASATS